MAYGIWRGVVTRVDDDGVWVHVPRLSPMIEFGPCPATPTPQAYTAGERVLVAPIEGRPDDLVVLGAAGNGPPPSTGGGDPGPPGADGRTILPTTGAPTGGMGVNGDFALDVPAGVLYGPKVGGVWPAGRSLVGAAGAPGVDGRTVLATSGAPSNGTGQAGDFAIDVAAGVIYGPKTTTWPAARSLIGPAGSNGTNGTNGVNGNTILATTGAPSAGVGVAGDYALDVAAGIIYGPKTTVWPAGRSIVGAQGTPGTNGTNGAAGSPGAAGKTILATTGAPSNGTGTDGDYAMDVPAGVIYGPKASGVWPAGRSLVGATGSAGVGIPTGGGTGQALLKQSGTNYDVAWGSPTAAAPSNMATTDTAQTISGAKAFTGGVDAGSGSSTGAAPLRAFGSAPANPVAILKAAGSQTGDLLQARDSGENVIAKVTAAGTVAAGGVTAYGPADATASALALLVRAAAATQRGVAVQGAASQSADLAQFLDSAGSVLAKVTAGGLIYEGSNRVYSAANPQAAPSNMLTTDTTQTVAGSKSFQASTGGPAPLIGKAAVGAITSQNVQEWYDNNGALASRVASDGTILGYRVYEGTGNRVYSPNNPQPTPINMATLDTAQTITGQKLVTPPDDTTIPLVLTGNAARTADLLRMRLSSNTSVGVAGITGAGNLYGKNLPGGLDLNDLLTTKSYTPAITGTTNPGLGTSPIKQGDYSRIGRWVILNILIQLGTGTLTPGSGLYSVSLPSGLTAQNGAIAGVLHASATTTHRIPVVGYVNGSTISRIEIAATLVNSSIGNNWGAGVYGIGTSTSTAFPYAMLAGDQISFSGVYLLDPSVV
jgi:hypothetical protein